MYLLKCCSTGQVGCDFLSVGSGNTRPRLTLCLSHNCQTASHMAIRYVGSSLPSINMICLLFPSHPCSVFLSAVASDVLGLVCTCEKQLPRDPSSSSRCLPESFMLLCMNPAMFQTAPSLRSALTFLWHFSGSAGTQNLVISCQGTRFSD